MSESNACIRILHVIGSMELGGAETFVMNLYRNIDRTKVQFDIVVHTQGRMFYSDEIERLGGKIFCAPRFNGINLIQYEKWWRSFFEQHPEYRIVHGHIGSVASVYLGIAKKYGRLTIAHSHRTKGNLNFMELVFRCMTFSTRYIADYFMGCSVEAGRDRYGEKIIRSDRFYEVKNGIDTEKYRFSSDRRKQCRAELGIRESDVVWGHVGRFAPVKNHKKIIEVFNVFHRSNPGSVLLLFGEGPEKGSIIALAEEYKISNAVRFMGLTDRIDYFLQAMDLFIFPSEYEGLGIALIEAETSGLPCVVSDAIVDEADIGAGLLTRLSLSDPPEKWSEVAVDAMRILRKDTSEYAIRSGFDIKSVAKEIETFYLDQWNKSRPTDNKN